MPSAAAVEHFRRRLAFETDPADLAAALAEQGDDAVVLIDTRRPEAYRAGHLPGARNLPHQAIDAGSTADLPHDRPLVTYCWGPACNAATKGALRLAELGFDVRELLGGYEYWCREGHPVATDPA